MVNLEYLRLTFTFAFTVSKRVVVLEETLIVMILFSAFHVYEKSLVSVYKRKRSFFESPPHTAGAAIIAT